MLLHYLVKYLCSKNRNAQEVIEENSHLRLSHSKNCFKIFVWVNIHSFNHQQNGVHTSHIKKIQLPTVHNCCNKEKDVATKCRT